MSDLQGWVKIHRTILNWEWFQDANMVQLALYCILKANHSDTKYKGIDIKRGEFITSLPSLCEDLGMKMQPLRTCLDRLKKCDFLTDKTTNKYRIISVCNYSTYQEKNEEANRQNNRQLTGKQQTTNRQLTADKNDKNKNNDKNDKNNIISLSQCDAEKEKIDFGFEDFWKLFSGANRGSKAKARISYEKALKGKILIEKKKVGETTHEWIMQSARKMISALKAQNQRQNKGLMDYCKHPVTWLNQAGWLDYPQEQAQNEKRNDSDFDIEAFLSSPSGIKRDTKVLLS